MEKTDAVAALAALAQDNRLDVFRLLVRAGPRGMSAGAVAETLELAPNTLTFHFDRLRQAGLITVRRDGRSMIYAARFETMNALLDYLTEREATPLVRLLFRRGRNVDASWELFPREWDAIVGDRTVSAVLRLALSFFTWRTLVREGGLKPGAAVEAMVQAVDCAR